MKKYISISIIFFIILIHVVIFKTYKKQEKQSVLSQIGRTEITYPAEDSLLSKANYLSASYKTARIPSHKITNDTAISLSLPNSKVWMYSAATQGTFNHTGAYLGLYTIAKSNNYLMDIHYRNTDTIKIQINRDSINSNVTWINDSTFILIKKHP